MSDNFEIKDSGQRREYGTGMVRDTSDGKPDYGLRSPYAQERVALHLTKGIKKYGRRNWENGAPISDFYASVQRHLRAYEKGDRSEDHIAAAQFGLDAIAHFEELAKLGAALPNGSPVIDLLDDYASKVLADELKAEAAAEATRLAQEAELARARQTIIDQIAAVGAALDGLLGQALVESAMWPLAAGGYVPPGQPYIVGETSQFSQDAFAKIRESFPYSANFPGIQTPIGENWWAQFEDEFECNCDLCQPEAPDDEWAGYFDLSDEDDDDSDPDEDRFASAPNRSVDNDLGW